MDRRYLAATLAIVGTFLVISHGFRSLEQVVMAHAQRMNAHAIDKWHPGATHLRTKFPRRSAVARRNERAHGEDARRLGGPAECGTPGA